MNILGIGISELVFIVLIILIVLGPKDMQKASKTIAGQMRKIITSPEWRAIKDASQEAKDLPNKWMREAGLEEIQNELGLDKDLLTESGRPRFVVPKQKDAIEVLAEKEND